LRITDERDTVLRSKPGIVISQRVSLCLQLGLLIV